MQQELSRQIERIEARAELMEQEKAKADALFLSIGDGAIATDENGIITRVNQAGLDILGFTEKEVVGKWFPRRIISLDDNGKLIEPIDRPIMRVFLTGKPISRKIFYRVKGGKTVPVWVTVSPIILNDKPVGAIEVFRDITHEQEIDRMKSEFISIASHQLRTPLSAVKTYSYMLYDGYGGEMTLQQKEFMHIILNSVYRMNGIISTLLNVTRIETGNIAVIPRPTHLEKIVEEIVTELKPRAEEKNISIKTIIQNKPPAVMTDRLLTKEVYANLLTNAIKYTPENGSVKLRLNVVADRVTFSVEDSGYGIPKNVQNRIFTKFFRADNILDKDTAGTGLGLYLVKGIAERLDGDIWFKSIEGKGSTFYFSIPKKGILTQNSTVTLESSY